MNYLAGIIAKGFLYGTAPSTSQIILKVASKFVNSHNSIDEIISQISTGISSNMVCNLDYTIVLLILL